MSSYFHVQSVSTVMQETMQPSLPCAFREEAAATGAAAASAVMYSFPSAKSQRFIVVPLRGGDKLTPVCHYWPELPHRAFHHTFQMEVLFYHSLVGDITSSCWSELMIRANISVLT